MGGARIKLTLADFITKSVAVHGDRYDYSRSVYINNHTKTMLVCKLHGEFYQEPHSHLRGAGCPRCSSQARRSNVDFIQSAKSVHGDRYDYSRVNYIGCDVPVTLKCKIHGKFSQTPYQHVARKHGCPMCGGSARLTRGTFVEISARLHGDRYDYSTTNYINSHTKVNIRCRACCQIFAQRPYAHIHQKAGCPICSHYVSDKEIRFLDFLHITERQFHVPGIRGAVDGIDRTSNTIYEFLGDYWHGNPDGRYPAEAFNTRAGKTFGELHRNTLTKFDRLSITGYTVKYIWERDWDGWLKNPAADLPIKTHQQTILCQKH